jgi:hypothetical protein
MNAPLRVDETQTSEAITADREEKKYLIPRAPLEHFLRNVSQRLPLHRFVGSGANRLPDPRHFVTTVYFDTASHAQLRTAISNLEHNVKIRAREYYDLHASLAEIATDPSQIVRYQPWVWFEIKRRDAGRTQKQRFRLEKREVPLFFRGEHAAFSVAAGEQLDPDLAGIVAYRRTLTEPLVPSCIVNYQRIAFQDASGSLRITVDLDIGFYRAPPDLWTRDVALVRGTFGRPHAVERSALVELKSRGPLPAWLSQLLLEARLAPCEYSKFVRAGRAVHGLD